jgi:hypothetical protein
MRAVGRALFLVAFAVEPVRAQRGGTILGTVRDSLAQPVPAADVVAHPGSYRTRSDSAGNFLLTGLDGGTYTVAARKVGYAPDRWDVTLKKSGRLELKFVLARRVELDTVTVKARRDCPAYSLDGFTCRRRSGGGVFLDYPEIDERRPTYTADLFRDMPGFRVDFRRTRYGLVRVPVAVNGFGCIASLVDGRPASAANEIPLNPSDLSAMEVYLHPDSVPETYQRYTWPASNLHRSGRCSVIVYWTIWAPLNR